MFVRMFVLILLVTVTPGVAKAEKEADQLGDFKSEFDKYADELEAFPIDYLLMSKADKSERKSLYKEFPRLAKSIPPWSYFPFRYEMNDKRMKLYCSFVRFGYYATEEDRKYCEKLIEKGDAKEKTLAMTILFLSAEPKYIPLFKKLKNDTSIAFPSITVTEEDKQKYEKEMEAFLTSQQVFDYGGPGNRFEMACIYWYQSRGGTKHRYEPEIVFDNAENSSEKPKTVADFANAFLWYWYHFEEDKKLEPKFLFAKFMLDDRTIPVFPDEKYEELQRRLKTEPFYYTKASIRWAGALNGPPQYRLEMCDEVRKYVESLPKDAHFLLMEILK